MEDIQIPFDEHWYRNYIVSLPTVPLVTGIGVDPYINPDLLTPVWISASEITISNIGEISLNQNNMAAITCWNCGHRYDRLSADKIIRSMRNNNGEEVRNTCPDCSALEADNPNHHSPSSGEITVLIRKIVKSQRNFIDSFTIYNDQPEEQRVYINEYGEEMTSKEVQAMLAESDAYGEAFMEIAGKVGEMTKTEFEKLLQQKAKNYLKNNPSQRIKDENPDLPF